LIKDAYHSLQVESLKKLVNEKAVFFYIAKISLISLQTTAEAVISNRDHGKPLILFNIRYIIKICSCKRYLEMSLPASYPPESWRSSFAKEMNDRFRCPEGRYPLTQT